MEDLTWCNLIIKQELSGNWKVARAADGYCWFDGQVIQLPYEASESIFLHELAHALCQEPEQFGQGFHYHGGMWASTFGKLVDKYMQPL